MKRAPISPSMLTILVLGSSLCSSAAALAGGLFLPAHGARGLGRAGAFVAGGDDPGAIWYNPASLGASTDIELLADTVLALNSASYARVDASGIHYPTVYNEPGVMPILTVAFTMPLPRLWSRRWWIGASLAVPTASLPTYPQPSYDACGDPPRHCLDTVPEDAPQRYSLVSLGNSIILRLDLVVALELLPSLTIGLALQNLISSIGGMKSITVFNGILASGPEDPDFDVLGEINVVDLFSPSAQLGLRYDPASWITLGLSVQMPFLIRGEGEVSALVPASPLHAGTSIEGNRAYLRIMLPLSAGAGIEVRPLRGLRLEADLHWEHWSGTATDCPQSSLASFGIPTSGCEILLENKDIYVLGAPAVPSYKVPSFGQPLGFRDALSVRLGLEHTLRWPPVALRAGYGYERGAVRPEAHSVLAYDMNKHLLTAGAGLRLGSFRLDAAFGLVLMPALVVDHKESTARQINPIRPDLTTTIGGGTYNSRSYLFAGGLNTTF